jgi:UPF0176 protein
MASEYRNIYTLAMASPLSIAACYAFVPVDEAALAALREDLMLFGKKIQLQGLVLIAPEGVNATVAGSAEAIQEWKAYVTEHFGPTVFKDSKSEGKVFRRWSVKIKEEIVGLKDTSIRPAGRHRHLSPEEWQEVINKEEVIVLDARNDYETALGKFRGAVDPGLRTFGEFTEFAQSSALPKDKKILMYCTGGIRCEKALLAMEAAGYEDVYQLEGGILAYLERFPEGEFEGECFVFDHRVAVDQYLRPSQIYDLCPHCGDPGDQMIECFCGKKKKICSLCQKDDVCQTCSKRCAGELRQKLARV